MTGVFWVIEGLLGVFCEEHRPEELCLCMDVVCTHGSFCFIAGVGGLLTLELSGCCAAQRISRLSQTGFTRVYKDSGLGV